MDLIALGIGAIVLFAAGFLFRKAGRRRRNRVEDAAKRAVERRLGRGGAD